MSGMNYPSNKKIQSCCFLFMSTSAETRVFCLHKDKQKCNKYNFYYIKHVWLRMSWAQFWVTGWGVEDSDSPRWRFIKQQLQIYQLTILTNMLFKDAADVQSEGRSFTAIWWRSTGRQQLQPPSSITGEFFIYWSYLQLVSLYDCNTPTLYNLTTWLYFKNQGNWFPLRLPGEVE